ncbi:hypothetical protein SLS53_001634 [Cytospora paraplurivora]|uniref:ABC transporter n=1 Tax=Cytospora paraplurivora TaxID=2898453 RepID=A0AAN9YM48_9PEZI
MIRGGLAITIFEKLLRLPEGDKIESTATTLMVEDLQRVMSAVARGHELWAGIIETGLATWLLYRQLGPSCFVMLGLTAVAGLGSMRIMKKAGSSQQRWLAATQKRLKRTKQMLDSLKGIKMTSQESVAYQILTKLRLREIKESSSFRWIILTTAFLSYVPSTLSSPLIFGVYVSTASSGYNFSVSKIFTSLVTVTLLSSPLVHLFQVLPQIGGAYGCFQRLHEFLQLEEKYDYREIMLDEKTEASGPESPPAGAHIMLLRDLSLGWNAESSPILKRLNLRVEKGANIAIVGSVGTGKTLLMKGLIGEAHKTHGQLTLAPSTSVAYCSQTAWLENISTNGTITQYGKEPGDSEFYRQLASDCALDDLVALPTFASESIGSGGVKLSGGQRQRLALARALSTKSDIMILDDVFSALDRRTRWRIATNLLKRNTAKLEKTIIYTTHDEQIANLADEVYQIDELGHLIRRPDLGLASIASGKGKHLESPELASLENMAVAEDSSIDDHPNTQTPTKARSPLDAVERQAAKQMIGDRAVYKTYAKSVGWLHSTIFIVGAMAWAVSFKFSGLGVLALLVLAAWLYHQQFNIITRSGKLLHGQLATTVFKAQFPIISHIDTGTTLNRFSQDLMFVDMQLPIDLFNTSSEFFTAIIQIVLITVASLPMLCAIPVLFVVLYIVQHFYLRTSKQLRLQEIDAKAALVTAISETGSGAGLSTIRAHGWSDIAMARFLEKLDRSQEPLYLLYAVQRWLQLVLNLVVAGVVVAMIGASVALKTSNKVSAGAVGVAFLNAVTLGETLTQFIVAYTGLETSLGAIARIALFQLQTPVEEDNVAMSPTTETHQEVLTARGPGGGAIRFENVWATYDSSATSTAGISMNSQASNIKWSLRGVSLDIKPGERIAVCGTTGSGKSTMHLALLRMVYTPIGSIFIDGADHASMSLEALRKHFLVITQDKLESFNTLREELDPHGVFSDSRVESVLLECGIMDMVLNTPGGLTAKREDCKFSAGEEQLLSVARVILDVEREAGAPGNQGGIVLLDEVTSSIDRKTEEKIEFLLKTRLGGRTLIAINHRLEAVLDYDRVVVLDHGKVDDIGTPAELVSRCGLFVGLRIPRT